MAEPIRTRPFEISEDEYVKALVYLQRKRMWIFDVVAAVLGSVVGHFIVGLPWVVALAIAPAVLILGFIRMPWRVKRMLKSPTFGRPQGAITFHVDEQGMIYMSSTVEPAEIKWEEVRAVRRFDKNYWIDAGFDDFLVTPAAFVGASDELQFQEKLRTKVRRVIGL